MEGGLFFQTDELGLGSVANSNLVVQTYLSYLWGPADKVVTFKEKFIQDSLPLCNDEEIEEDSDSASEFNEGAIKDFETYFEST